MSWLQSLRRRMLGPSAAEILQTIAMNLDSFSDLATKVANNNHRAAVGIEQAESRLADLLERLNSEPFMAIKRWIDQATKSHSDHAEQRREFKDRERQLLERWKNQVDSLDKRIAAMCAPPSNKEPVDSLIVGGKAARDTTEGELLALTDDEAAEALSY